VRRQVSPGEGRVLDVQQWGAAPPLMTYTTQRGGVHGMDLRMERDAWVVPAPPRLGVLQQARRGLVPTVGVPIGSIWLRVLTGCRAAASRMQRRLPADSKSGLPRQMYTAAGGDSHRWGAGHALDRRAWGSRHRHRHIAGALPPRTGAASRIGRLHPRQPLRGAKNSPPHAHTVRLLPKQDVHQHNGYLALPPLWDATSCACHLSTPTPPPYPPPPMW
jgi:hypothetical protein